MGVNHSSPPSPELTDTLLDKTRTTPADRDMGRLLNKRGIEDPEWRISKNLVRMGIDTEEKVARANFSVLLRAGLTRSQSFMILSRGPQRSRRHRCSDMYGC